jgi:LDH2 family malate/lactate/ureidoglycolate dehydrogenase
MAGMDSEVSHLASPAIRPRAELKVVWETQLAAALDENWKFGRVIAKNAMEIARKAPDNKTGEILVLGDKEYMTMEKRLREGIQVEDATWQAVKKTAQELSVNIDAHITNA